ncbi:MAG: chloride channel protein [Candidatus Eremiobacteraeota bacterium]|nr:chloride channel protein [Candidatus Eremiobacteraeota bacterium]
MLPVLIVGGVLTAFIVNRFAREAKGHGVPEVMAAVAMEGGVMRPRVIAVKSVASATCIGSAEAAAAKGRSSRSARRSAPCPDSSCVHRRRSFVPSLPAGPPPASPQRSMRRSAESFSPAK